MTSAKSNAKGSGIHYAWFVMMGCGMMVAGTVGSFTILSGSFFFPVCADLGIDFSTLTVYMTVLILGVAASLPFVGNLLPKLNLPVALTVIALVEIVAAGLMATYTEVWMWYL